MPKFFHFLIMKTTATSAARQHRIGPILPSIFLLLLPEIINLVGAQSGSQSPPVNQPIATFTPSLAIIVAVLVAALFFMGFFSVYIRHCGETSAGGSVVRRAISLRNRRASAARGLDASVIESFPIFSYSEVKDHHVGKGSLECAVCLNEFEDDETLRLIPKCDHVFHAECIDPWLESHVTCPVCRANLVPQPVDEPAQLPNPIENPTDNVNDSIGRTNSRNEEVVIDVDVNEQTQRPKVKRNTSFEYANQLPRSWSVKMFGFGKFRSRSTGHSLIQPGDNLDRFTLKLPAQVRKDMMNRASLSRIGSYASTLPREGSSRRGYRGEGSVRAGRSYRKVDREAKSDRWIFFSRGLSMKVAAETGQGSSHGGSGSSRYPVKYPSFKCLEPKAADETVLFSDDQLAKNSV